MTVSTTTSRADYTGNGTTTAFAVPFYFLEDTHLTVLRTQISTGVITTLALTTNYTVSGAGNPAGGTVTCVVAPTADQKISILRNVPLTQLNTYVPNDPFPAASHERALDKLTMEVQQLDEAQDRALTLPANTPVGTVSTDLPTPQANRFIGWNNTATGLQNLDASSLATITAYGNQYVDVFSGNGVQTQFTLSQNPGALSNLSVSISGVAQRPTIDYTHPGGSVINFVSAPASGTNNIMVRYGSVVSTGVPTKDAQTFDTVAIVNSATIDGSVNHIRTAGYYANGDGGGALYRKGSTSNSLPTNKKFIYSLTGGSPTYQYWEISQDEVNVLQFGAKKDNSDAGTTTAAFNDAIAYVAALGVAPHGGIVNVPPGFYAVNATITMDSRVWLKGAGQLSSQIIRKQNTDYGDTIIASQKSGFSITDLMIDNRGPATSGTAMNTNSHIQIDRSSFFLLQNLLLLNGYKSVTLESVNTCRLEYVNATLSNAAGGLVTTGVVTAFSSPHGIKVGQHASGAVSYNVYFHNVKGWMGDANFTGSVLTSIDCYSDYAFLIESVDGLWMSDCYGRCAKLSCMRVGNSSAQSVSNIYVTNTMLDHSRERGLQLAGTANIALFRFEGRASNAGVGSGTNDVGIVIAAPASDVRIDATVEGFKTYGIVVNNASATDIVFVSPQVSNIDSDAGGSGYGIYLIEGKRVSISGGQIKGSGVDTGIWVAAACDEVVIDGVLITSSSERDILVNGASKVCISNCLLKSTGAKNIEISDGSSEVTVSNCLMEGAINVEIYKTSTNVLFSNCQMRGTTAKVSALGSGSFTNVRFENCPGYSPIYANVNWNPAPGTIADGDVANFDTGATISGVALGDFVEVSAPYTLDGMHVSAYVKATDNVVMGIWNNTGGNQTLSSTTGDFALKITKRPLG